MRRLIVIAARGLVVPPSPPRVRTPAPPSIFLRRGSHGTGIILPRGAMAKPPRPAPTSISLPLFDPLKRPFRRHRPTPICEPRISYPSPFNRLSPVKIHRTPSPDDRLDATRLALRINALSAALDDLPRQAHRLARWRANRERDKNRDAAGAQNGSGNAEAAILTPTRWGVRRTGETRGSPRNGPERSEGVRGPAPPKTETRPRLRRLSPLRPGRPPGSLRRPDHEVHDLLTELHGLAFDAFNDSS